MTKDLDELESKIKSARHEESVEEGKKREQSRKDADNMSMGMRAGAELISSIAAGGFIGWMLDGWLQTKPLFLIMLLLLGIMTGFYNVYRTTQNLGTSVGFSQLHKKEKNAKQSPDR